MRLINTSILSFHEFNEDEIPYGEYAVISHRWTNHEVSFKEYRKLLKTGNGDFSNVMQDSNSGLDKIVKSCAFARSRGRQYVWMDTCCIDKRSSAELSEAINSMYRWYRQAAECYVHLADVSTARLKEGETLIDLLGQSEWFSRGWTLQELLAPPNLMFLTADWQPLGWRQDDEIASKVASITGIGLYDLNNFRPSTLSAARKMSWASKRTTSRPEDLAYCLIGLFDVNMPLLYGEGGLKAFVRLQLEIIRKSDDKSIFAWDGDASGAGWCGLLAPYPSLFGNCDDVVNSRKHQNRFPYEMTNLGLSLQSEAEVVKGRATDKFVVKLGCWRMQNEAKARLAKTECYLILEPTDAAGVFYRKRQLLLNQPNRPLEEVYSSASRTGIGKHHFYVPQAGL